jgi:hypothetical protein
MITETATTEDLRAHTIARAVRPDSACRARATAFLVELIGSPLDDLLWDNTHCLRGHGHLRGREIVVIAPRDDDHGTIVLTAEDWDVIRLASGDQRCELLERFAIVDHHRLIAVLGDRCEADTPTRRRRLANRRRGRR